MTLAERTERIRRLMAAYEVVAGAEHHPCPNCGMIALALRANGLAICTRCCWDLAARKFDLNALSLAQFR